MFVSNMLKKCVNLLSHDFSKSSLKKEVDNENHTPVLDKKNEHNELSGSSTSNIHNRNLGVVTTDENPVLRIECKNVIDNNVTNPIENINTTNHLLKHELQQSICIVQQETVIANGETGSFNEISTRENIEDTLTLEYKSEDFSDVTISGNEEENFNNQLVKNEPHPNACWISVQQEIVIANGETGSFNEISTGEIIEDTLTLEHKSEDFIDVTISGNEEENSNNQLVKNEPHPNACWISDEHTTTATDSTHAKNSSGNSPFNNSNTRSENVDNDLNLPVDTVNINAVYFSSEPTLDNNIECSKIINTVESIHCVNSENQVEENVGDEDIGVADLGVTIIIPTNSDIVDSVNADVDYNVNDEKHSDSGLLLDVGVNIQTSVNQTEDIDKENSVSLSANLQSESMSVNRNTISDTEITKEELISSAVIIINENRNSKTMAEFHDKDINLDEQISELKLQLNASQQVRASLELQLTQKEEVIIKSQTEALRKQQSYKQEIKQLREKLEEKNLEDDNTPIKELQESNKSLKLREAKLLSELNARKNDEQNYRKIMDEFEKTIGTQVSELEKLNEEHSVVKRHLATLELAFSDVLQKYDRSKKIIEGFKCNEDALRHTLAVAEDNIIKSDQKYESLKAHAKAQIEKCNQEILLIREQYDSEIHKLTAIVKRLEIKNASLTDSLDQKNKECSALAALCDEVTGKV